MYFFGWFSLLVEKMLKITGLSIRLLLRLRPTAPNFPEYWFTNKFNLIFDSSAFNQDLQHVQPFGFRERHHTKMFVFKRAFVSDAQDNVVKELPSTEQRRLLHF